VTSPVELGISHQQLINILGDPDVFSHTSKKDPHSKILKYDDLEFHFGAGYGDELWMIFSDNTVDGEVKVCIRQKE
jgi:hypothetical protein